MMAVSFVKKSQFRMDDFTYSKPTHHFHSYEIVISNYRLNSRMSISVAVANKNLGALGNSKAKRTFAAVGWGGEHL